ncbi:type II toxin-antitoxin system death-on-curing family toxin [Veillonella sp. S13053-19]|uniref:type II toxin-antitoxin system death-on-curing family toxin n=2 Tax=Bacillota TaxID=1239 RepID=UPI000CF4A23E|nr:MULTISPECIES: type II toxin-antitoxin system death-on-curing family toxin [Bacillota]MBF1269252.1 type II toxin-antitoxin system death-on-curing family toxin [Oribacterium parvum]PQL14321.1 type II toxin-antitoxin system death-on-curing family toxin [Veillonella sp. S13053-19]
MSTADIQFTVQDIYELHIQLEETFILSSGIRDENLLASAVNTPFQTFMGNDLYPSIYDKAAQLCYGIANNHPFTDGNKRTALHSMYVYLISNGYDITATQQEVEKLIIDVAAGKMHNTELSKWLQHNTIEIEQLSLSHK